MYSPATSSLLSLSRVVPHANSSVSSSGNHTPMTVVNLHNPSEQHVTAYYNIHRMIELGLSRSKQILFATI